VDCRGKQAFPSGVFAADNVSPVMAKLSAYMSEAGGRALPEEVVEKAKHHILDTFAAMISGSDLPPARAAFSVRPRLLRLTRLRPSLHRK